MSPPDQIPEIARNTYIVKEYLSKKGGPSLDSLTTENIQHSNEEQTIPGWADFYDEVTNVSEELMHDILYLPSINASPTKYGTVQQFFTQVNAIAEAPGSICTDLVLDHVIYAKALEVLKNLNNVDLKEFINPRMGGFHGCRIFLAVIGKRFGSAGLRDLIIEARLFGPESVN